MSLKTGQLVKIVSRPGYKHDLELQIGQVRQSGKYTSVVQFGFNSYREIENDVLHSLDTWKERKAGDEPKH